MSQPINFGQEQVASGEIISATRYVRMQVSLENHLRQLMKAIKSRWFTGFSTAISSTNVTISVSSADAIGNGKRYSSPHLAEDTANVVAAADASDLATLITLLTECQTDYNAHRVSLTYHLAADTVNTLALAAPIDLTTCIAAIKELKLGSGSTSKGFNGHRSQSGVHYTSDGKNEVSSPLPDAFAPTDSGGDTVTITSATTQAQAITAANEWKADYNLHLKAEVIASVAFSGLASDTKPYFIYIDPSNDTAVASLTEPTNEKIILASVIWNGSALSSLTDLRVASTNVDLIYIDPGTTQGDALVVSMTQPTAAGQRDSHYRRIRGASYDTTRHTTDWRDFIDITSNAGASTLTFQSRIDAAAYANRLLLTDAGALTVTSLTVSGLTANTMVYAGAGGALTSTAAPTNGQLLIGSTGAAPALATLTAGTNILITNAAASITVALTGTVAIANGGTNSAAALSNNRIMVSSAGAIVEAGAMTNGQLLIGSTSAAPVVAALAAGTNIAITNAAGSITVGITGTVAVANAGTGLTTYVLGDVIYASAANTLSALAGNITTTKKFLRQTGTGAASAAPAWDTVDAGDVTSGVFAIARGGTNSGTALSNNRIMVSSSGAIVEAAAMTNGQLLIGSTSAAPVVAALTAGANITITNAAGSITIAASGTVGTALSALTAATASNTIASGDFAQVWQWALTTADKIAFRISESAASTATGNPVLAQIDTLAASTLIPLMVKTRGTEVFRVSATATQILMADGTAAAPISSYQSDPDTGRFNAGANIEALSLAGAETKRWETRIETVSYAAADTTAYSIRGRKARGTVASPTVLTTGDDLLTISAYGYVGATNTYVEAAQILFDSTGTIADTTTGIGGVIDLLTRDVGGALTRRLRLDNKGSVVVGAAALATSATDGFLYIPSMAGTPTGTPTTQTGTVAMVFDTTNNVLYIYDGGWLGGTVPGVWS